MQRAAHHAVDETIDFMKRNTLTQGEFVRPVDHERMRDAKLL
jgi:hypothetical protein